MAQKRLLDVAERPRNEAMILLAHCLERESIWIMTHEDELVDAQPFLSMVDRRANFEPIEYITSKVSFYSQTFYIAPGALIPRPETELLIEAILQNLDAEFEGHIVEVGVGSGIISIVLAQKFPKARITAVDISSRALEIAKLNCVKFDLEERITLIEGNLLDPIEESIDLLVSNPPYIEDDIELPKSLSFEPQNALYGGKVGDELLKLLIEDAAQRKIPMIACEMGYDQKERIETFVALHTKYKSSFYKDLASLDRGFILKEK